MGNYKVVKYSSLHCQEWDMFIAKAKNATFLFNRSFIEYHQDRFEDFSLLVFQKDKLVAVFPANKLENSIYSHQGLSYGGLLILSKTQIKEYIEIFKALLIFLNSRQVASLFIRRMPYIYFKRSSDELEYVLSLLKSDKVFTDSYFILDDLQNYMPNRNRRRALQLSSDKGVEICEDGIEYFWEKILTLNLLKRFKVKPVHRIDEIKMLIQRFPDNIKFYSAKIEDKIEAGVVLFITENVAHFQYSSGGENRAKTGALDFLFHSLILKYSNKKCISFGSSSIDRSLKINTGLAYWKESFGARTITQSFYKINTENYKFLENVFV